MLKTLLNILILFFSSFAVSSAQDVAHIKAGVLLVHLKNNKFSFRPGINLGVQAKIGAPGFYMSPGIFYQKFTILEFDKKKYINDKPKYHLVKLNVDAGLEKSIVKLFRFRVFAGVNLNRVIKIDNNSHNINFDNVYEGFAGYDFGLGFNIAFMTIDFKQERSFTGFYKDYKKTKLNFTTISLGVVF